MTIRSNDLEGLTFANGRYLITAKLGEGGMGSVYRALDRNIESDVVIKIPRQAMMEDPEFASRFTREIRSLVKLSHPHIVKVSDVGTWENTPFAVMQFLPGGSLEDRRPTGPDGQPRPCDRKQVPRWLDAVAEALDYIHTQGYVHRDVKPGNILFDAQGHAFLSDFGVAKVLASSADTRAAQTAVTGAGMVLGTPEYMAPELIMGEPFDGRVDQYALAVTVYELLCGRRPFENETKTKVLVLHTTKAPPRLTECCPALPERLSQAVLRGLAKDPNERYLNCVALAAAVAAAAEGAAAREDRVRLKCPGCGKTGAMAAADYARLRESGGRPSCSACKLPLDVVTSASQRTAGGAGPGGTMRISSSGISGEFALSSEPEPARGGTTAHSVLAGSGGHASPSAPKAAPGGTMPMSAQPSHGERPTDPEPRPISAPRASKTLIERPSPQPEEKAAAAVFSALATSESQRLKAPTRPEAGGAGGAAASRVNPVQTWITVGAAAVGSLLVLTFVVMWLMPGKETGSTAPPPSPKAPAVASVVTPQPPAAESQPRAPQLATTPEPNPTKLAEKTTADPPKPSVPPVATTSNPNPTKLAEKTAADPLKPSVPPAAVENRPDANPSAPAGGQVATGAPDKVPAADPAPSSKSSLAMVTPRESKPAATNIAISRFDPVLLKHRPRKAGYPLDKVLAKSQSYASQIVIPTGMYHLARSQTDRSDGKRRFLVTERKIQSRRDNSLGMSSSASTELEVEPHLAERLDNLEPDQWKEKVAILSLWFTGDRTCVLVKVEILEQYVTGFKKGTVYPQGDVDYETLVVTPEKSERGKGLDEDWEEPGRMLHFANLYKKKVMGYKKMLQSKEQSQLNSVMSNMWGNMMKDAAADSARQQQMQRALTGGR